jgi:hypothetical protein
MLIEMLRTENLVTGAVRWFVGGKRVSEKEYLEINNAAVRKECFVTRVSSTLIRHYHSVR